MRLKNKYRLLFDNKMYILVRYRLDTCRVVSAFEFRKDADNTKDILNREMQRLGLEMLYKYCVITTKIED